MSTLTSTGSTLVCHKLVSGGIWLDDLSAADIDPNFACRHAGCDWVASMTSPIPEEIQVIRHEIDMALHLEHIGQPCTRCARLYAARIWEPRR